jgi:hypothetical protein
VEGAVVEDAEEEHEVERTVLTELLGAAQVAVDPGVRRGEVTLPLVVQRAVLLEVREREEHGPQLLVDPARMDAVLRSDLEHPQPRPAPAGRDVLESLEREREVDVLGRDRGRALVADRPRVDREGRVRVELLPVVVQRDVARELQVLRAPVDGALTGPPADGTHGRRQPHR